MEAARAAAAASAARAFCSFLERRVRVRNAGMLRLLVDDFLAGRRAASLRDFVQLGATMVVVQPFEELDRERRREAARLLAGQREATDAVLKPDDPLLPASPWRSLREREQRCCAWVEFLGARVCVRNLRWLYEMMAQFLLGEERRIQQFLDFGGSVVSILPVEVAPGTEEGYAFDDGGSEAHLLLATVSSQGGSSNDQAAERPKRSFSPGHGGEERGEDAHSTNKHNVGDNGGEPATPRKRRRRQPVQEEANRLRRQQTEILELFDKVQEAQPWEKVYHKDIKLPFSEKKHPRIATALRSFFAKHGRAVWERNFWAPLSREYDADRAEMRSHRQASAVKFFQRYVIEPVYRAFGAEFFVQLDRQQPRPVGWWFRGKIVDLHTMYRKANGPQVLRKYLETQATSIHPLSVALKQRYRGNGNQISASMWSSNQSLEGAVKQIKELKRSGAVNTVAKEARKNLQTVDEGKDDASDTEEVGEDYMGGEEVDANVGNLAGVISKEDSKLAKTVPIASKIGPVAEIADGNGRNLDERSHKHVSTSLLVEGTKNEDNRGGGQLVLGAQSGARSRNLSEHSDSEDDKSVASSSSPSDQDHDHGEEGWSRSMCGRRNHRRSPPRLYVSPGGTMYKIPPTQEDEGKDEGDKNDVSSFKFPDHDSHSGEILVRPRYRDDDSLSGNEAEREDVFDDYKSPDDYLGDDEEPESPRPRDRKSEPTRVKSDDNVPQASDVKGEETIPSPRSPDYDSHDDDEPASPRSRDDNSYTSSDLEDGEDNASLGSAVIASRIEEAPASPRSYDDDSHAGSETEGQRPNDDGDVVDLTAADSPYSSVMESPTGSAQVRWRTNSEGVIIFDDEDGQDGQDGQRARDWDGTGW